MSHNIRIKGITDEDFVNYKVPSMFIAASTCTFKCDKECGVNVCQNGSLARQKTISVDAADLCNRYMSNKITRAIVLGGLEPFDQFDDILFMVGYLRASLCTDDVVIYTGYNRDEIEYEIKSLSTYPNVVVKYGRFIPGQRPHFDEVLGVNLASDNQYAERIS